MVNMDKVGTAISNAGYILVLSGIAALFISACGDKEVSFATQEDSRRQAIENAEYNANNWRNTNAPEHKILMRGDSTISASCAQGDGWATVDLKADSKDSIELKCSTVSGTVGCLEKKDFQERSYSKQDGRCDKKLPVPLPKIQK